MCVQEWHPLCVCACARRRARLVVRGGEAVVCAPRRFFDRMYRACAVVARVVGAWSARGRRVLCPDLAVYDSLAVDSTDVRARAWAAWRCWGAVVVCAQTVCIMRENHVAHHASTPGPNITQDHS